MFIYNSLGMGMTESFNLHINTFKFVSLFTSMPGHWENTKNNTTKKKQKKRIKIRTLHKQPLEGPHGAAKK